MDFHSIPLSKSLTFFVCVHDTKSHLWYQWPHLLFVLKCVFCKGVILACWLSSSSTDLHTSWCPKKESGINIPITSLKFVTLLFQTILLDSLSDLHRYIDTGQIGADLGGSLNYNHADWVDLVKVCSSGWSGRGAVRAHPMGTQSTWKSWIRHSVLS